MQIYLPECRCQSPSPYHYPYKGRPLQRSNKGLSISRNVWAFCLSGSGIGLSTVGGDHQTIRQSRLEAVGSRGRCNVSRTIGLSHWVSGPPAKRLPLHRCWRLAAGFSRDRLTRTGTQLVPVDGTTKDRAFRHDPRLPKAAFEQPLAASSASQSAHRVAAIGGAKRRPRGLGRRQSPRRARSRVRTTSGARARSRPTDARR
jgi:hypothetical protein